MIRETIAKKRRKLFNAIIEAAFYNRFAQKIIGTITHFRAPDAVALTFDDGPHPEHTPRLLDILSRYCVRATFFPIGEFAQKHPELIRRMAEAEHAIGNHSWSHAAFPFIASREQIRASAEVLVPYEQKIFRPHGSEAWKHPAAGISINRYSTAAFKNILQRAGFSVVDYKRHGYASFWPLQSIERSKQFKIEFFLHNNLTRLSKIVPIDRYANEIIAVAKKVR